MHYFSQAQQLPLSQCRHGLDHQIDLVKGSLGIHAFHYPCVYMANIVCGFAVKSRNAAEKKRMRAVAFDKKIADFPKKISERISKHACGENARCFRSICCAILLACVLGKYSRVCFLPSHRFLCNGGLSSRRHFTALGHSHAHSAGRAGFQTRFLLTAA